MSRRFPAPDANCAVGFIDEHFGLAVSAGNIYALFASTYYPSGVTDDGGGPVYCRRQVLVRVPRSDFGSGY